MPTLSVIIPTHKRADILAECLRCLDIQTVVSDIEVIVVSDGADAKTSALFEKASWRFPVRFFEIEKSQQGAARNAGVAHASGEIALFIGDDIFIEPHACEEHLKAHSGNEEGQRGDCASRAVLGFTTWDPACDITPVMRWLEASGWQFGYPAISHYAGRKIPSRIQHRFTYTSHISIPLSLAKKHPFRTDVHLYGWEDIEWGMRLQRDGVHLVYMPAAKALHHHHLDLEASLLRMETLGRSAVALAANVPDFDRVPHGWKRWAYEVLALFPTMAGKHRRAYLRGMRVR